MTRSSLSGKIKKKKVKQDENIHVSSNCLLPKFVDEDRLHVTGRKGEK